MTTGMTTAERWYEVARRVAGGAFFGDAVYGVFDNNPANVIGSANWTNWDLETDDEYEHYYIMLALFLAYEAEDEENERLLIQHLIDANPEPVTMVAEEEAILPVRNHTSGSYASNGLFVGTYGAVAWDDTQVERRKSWNAKLADGMRKWADWVDEEDDGWYDRIAPKVAGSVVNLDRFERRKSWNQKVADGLRKWAHWMEERF